MSDASPNPYASPRTRGEGAAAAEPVLAPGESIRIEGRVTLDEAGEALALLGITPFGAAVATVIAAWSALLWLVSVILDLGSRTNLLLGASTVVPLVVSVLWRYLRRRSLARRWASSLREHHVRVFTDEGLQTISENTTVFNRWPAFNKYLYTDRVLLLSLGPSGTYYLIPRSLFPSDDAWRQALRLVASHVDTGPKAAKSR